MRSILTRFAFLGIAGTLAISAILPASAATHHRAPSPSMSSEPNLNEATVAARGADYTQTGPVWRGPNECFTDEGYGRFSSCDARGSQ